MQNSASMVLLTLAGRSPGNPPHQSSSASQGRCGAGQGDFSEKEGRRQGQGRSQGWQEKEAPKESPRMQKLKQLSFDRRPSAILKAWGARAPPEEPKEKTPSDRKPPRRSRTLWDEEMKTFARQVTLGNWPAVKAYVARLPADEAKAGYEHLLQSLQSGPAANPAGGMRPGMPPMAMQYAGTRNRFSPEDVLDWPPPHLGNSTGRP